MSHVLLLLAQVLKHASLEAIANEERGAPIERRAEPRVGKLMQRAAWRQCEKIGQPSFVLEPLPDGHGCEQPRHCARRHRLRSHRATPASTPESDASLCQENSVLIINACSLASASVVCVHAYHGRASEPAPPPPSQAGPT